MKAMTVNLKGLEISSAEIKEEITKSWRLIMLFLLLLGGMISGAFFYKRIGTDFSQIITEKMTLLLDSGFAKILAVTGSVMLLSIVLCIINSFSALGMPLLLIIPPVFGFLLSILCSYFYTTYRIDGVVFSLLLIFPAAVINVLMLLIGCNESLILSGIVSRNVFSSNKEGRGELKAFFARYGVIIIITLLVCIIDSIAISAIGKSLLV